MIDLSTRTTDANSHTLIMEISGRADAVAAQFLSDCIEGHVESGYSNFILDCTQLHSISSSALGTLVRVNRRRGISVSLVSVPGTIAEIFRVTHLNRLVRLYDTVEEAIEATHEVV